MPQIEKGKSMNDDVVKKLEYWAFKLCGKGEQEDAASDVMSEALREVVDLRAAVEKLTRELDEARAEVERLKSEPETLRAELIAICNASRAALANAYDRARGSRKALEAKP